MLVSSVQSPEVGSGHLWSFLRLQAFVNGLLPQRRVAKPYGGVHPDIFQQKCQHVEPLLVIPKHFAFDQFDLLRAELMVLLLDLGTAPLPTLTLDVEFHTCASFMVPDHPKDEGLSGTGNSATADFSTKPPYLFYGGRPTSPARSQLICCHAPPAQPSLRGLQVLGRSLPGRQVGRGGRLWQAGMPPP